ncbi:MAG: hypothetical protein HZB16_14635 [Armatimonadetes bacterium]|nr:hypothetical protein [Armatimonadota bacterium]
MDRVDITAVARHQLAYGGPAGERQLIWQAPSGDASPLGLRGIVALADAGGQAAAGQTAAFVLDHLERMLTAPSAPAATDRERLADYVYQCVLSINTALRDAGQYCALTCLCFRDDGFALAHIGGGGAYHLRVAHIHPLTNESTALLGQLETPEVSVGTGTIRPGDRIILTGRRLGQVVSAADLVSQIGQTDLIVACERVLRLAADRGQVEPTSITIAQVGPLPIISSSAPAAPPAAGEATMSYQPQPDYAPLGNPSRLDQLSPRQWLQYAVVAIVLALLLGVFFGRKSAQSSGTVAAGSAAPQTFTPVAPATPAPGTVVGAPPAPAPGAEAGVPVGAGAPLPTAAVGTTAAAMPSPPATPPAKAAAPTDKIKLVLSAKGKTFTVTPPAGSTVKLTGLGNYKPKQVGGGYEFTLKSEAQGQSYRFESTTGKTGAAPASKGALDDKAPRGAGLAPGTYKLLLGRGIEVAEIEVAAPSDVTSPAGPPATTTTTTTTSAPR